MIKKIIFTFSIILLISSILIGFGLYTLGIEDNYGDLQNLYYKSNNGDVIINRETKEFGIIIKDWKSIKVKTPKNEIFDLEYWVNRDNNYKIEIYRIHQINISKITFKEIENKIILDKLETVVENKKKR